MGTELWAVTSRHQNICYDLRLTRVRMSGFRPKGTSSETDQALRAHRFVKSYKLDTPHLRFVYQLFMSTTIKNTLDDDRRCIMIYDRCL